MATNHTENYNLNLWEPGDSFLRAEFNENTQKIDAALTENHIVTGSYQAVAQGDVTVSLGFRPRMVILTDNYKCIGLIIGPYAQKVHSPDNFAYVHTLYARLTDDGFVIEKSETKLNGTAGRTVYFAALP